MTRLAGIQSNSHDVIVVTHMDSDTYLSFIVILISATGR